MKPKAALGWTVGSVFLALLSAGVLSPAVDEGHGSPREARRGSDLKNVQTALESFRREYGHYPETGGVWRGDMTERGGFGYGADGFIPLLVPEFLPSLPKDPNGVYPDHRNGYMYRSDGADYKFVLRGTPENFDRGNPYLDPVRKDSWQVSSPGGLFW